MGKRQRRVMDPLVRRWIITCVDTAAAAGHTVSAPTSWLTSDADKRGRSRYIPACSCGWSGPNSLTSLRQAYRSAFIHLGEVVGDEWAAAAKGVARGKADGMNEQLEEILDELVPG